MLILSRRAGESIVINEDITVTIMDWKGNQVRVGIDAPPEIIVLREELVGNEQDREKTNAGVANPA